MSKMKYSGVEWIGIIPVEWKVQPLKYLYNMYAGGDVDFENYSVEKNEEYNIPIYSNSLDNDGLFGYTNRYRFFGNTFTVTGRGDVGKAIPRNEKFYPIVRLLVCVPKNKSDNRFYSYVVNSADLIGDQTAMAQLTTQKLGIIKVPIPSIKEQIQIADFLDEKVSNLDNILLNLNKQIEILDRYKKSMITETVTKGLNKNVEYKDSGIEWIGSIPKPWNIKLIKNICSLKGRIGWEGLTKDEYISEGPALITGINFKNGSIDWSSCEHVSEWRFNQDKSIQIKTGDLLITKDGTVGKVALVNDCPEQVTLNSGVLLIRPLNKDYIQRYLYYVLLSNEFWYWFEIENIGNTTIIHLYQNRFSKFKIALPPLLEQRKIVDYLDKKCEQIDKIIQEKQKQIEKIEEYKKSVIYEYVTGKKRVEGAEELYG